MPREFKLLVTALKMALREPRSVGQRGLSMVLGAGDPDRKDSVGSSHWNMPLPPRAG
jgi:hypothetical protein